MSEYVYCDQCNTNGEEPWTHKDICPRCGKVSTMRFTSNAAHQHAHSKMRFSKLKKGGLAYAQHHEGEYWGALLIAEHVVREYRAALIASGELQG